MENNPLKGIGKLGWTEAGRMHSTNKRLIATISDELNTKDKSKQSKVACDKCGCLFNIRGEKLPNHRRSYTRSIQNEITGNFEIQSFYEICDGDLVRPGKIRLDEYKFTFIRHTKPYASVSVDCIVKPGDNVIAEVKSYASGFLTTSIVEKTIKSITKTTILPRNFFTNTSLPRATIIILCTDGTELPLFVKDIVVV